MNIALWVITALLAFVFLAAGLMKISQPKAKLVAAQPALQDVSAGTIKTIGALEVLAPIGLILPALLSIATGVVPLAATGLILLMIGAAVTHARRGEYKNIVGNIILGGLALFVAIARFGPYSF